MKLLITLLVCAVVLAAAKEMPKLPHALTAQVDVKMHQGGKDVLAHSEMVIDFPKQRMHMLQDGDMNEHFSMVMHEDVNAGDCVSGYKMQGQAQCKKVDCQPVQDPAEMPETTYAGEFDCPTLSDGATVDTCDKFVMKADASIAFFFKGDVLAAVTGDTGVQVITSFHEGAGELPPLPEWCVPE